MFDVRYHALSLVAVQVALGAFTVLTGKDVVVTTAHVVTGALLLGAAVALSISSVLIHGASAAQRPS